MDLKHFFLQTQRSDRGVYAFRQGQIQYTTYAQLVNRAAELKSSWEPLRLRKSFIALLWMEQSIEMLQAFIAVKLAGGIAVPLHPFLPLADVRQIQQKLEAELLLYSTAKESDLFAADQPDTHTYYVNGETSARRMDSDVTHRQRERSYTPPQETSVIYLSSGSTGSPKGIMLSDRNLLTNVQSIQGYLQLEENDRVCISKSLGYCSTLTGEWLTALQAGCDLLLTSSFLHPLEMIRFIREHRPTFICTVPSTLIPLAKSTKWKEADLQSLRKLLLVGGSIPPEVLVQLKRRIPHVDIIVSYGLTEASPRVTYLPAHETLRKPQSVGIPVEGVSVRIVEQGSCLSPNQVGEIVVSGPNVMLGYYNDEVLSKQVLQLDGLYTRDMGYMDEDGYIYVTGRKDNALNVGGHTVYPESIEQILTLHPLVQEVGVASLDDEVWGQRLVAVIVPLEQNVKLSELYQYCERSLPSYLRPREIYIASTLPKTKTGKIDRNALRVWIMQKEGEHYGAVSSRGTSASADRRTYQT